MVSNKHQVLIGYTHRLCAEGLESMIENADDFRVIGVVPVKELGEYLNSLKDIDILIIELKFLEKSSLSFLVHLKKKHPKIRLMLISLLTCNDLTSKIVESGVDAYILKTCSKTDLFAALGKILEGGNFFCSEIIKSMLSANGNSGDTPEIDLTKRETEVLCLLVQGNTNMQIAKELSLSENTIKTHRKNILSKFGANNLIGLVRHACRARLLDYDLEGFCNKCPHYI